MTDSPIDPNHPWVLASTIARPQPIAANVSVDSIALTINGDNGPQKTEAALITIIDGTGVKNVFMPPEALHQLFQQIAAILQHWTDEAQRGFVIADKNMEREVTKNANRASHLRSVD